MNDPARRRPVSRLFDVWFGLRLPVDRRTYLLWGGALLVLKYALDAALLARLTGHLLNPLDYLSPLLGTRLPGTSLTESSFILWALAPWTLPFLWVGLSMTIRRAADAGLHPLVGVLVFVPVVNYLLVVLLCVLPAREASGAPRRDVVGSGLQSLLLSAASGAAVGVAMMLFSVMWLKTYGSTLFIGAPFSIGCVTGFFYNRGHRRGELATIGAAQLALFFVGGTLMACALEGAVCIAMVYPLAAVVATFGSLVGAVVAALPAARTAHVALMLLAWPLLTGVEALRHVTPLREVVSAVEIDAPPAAVWPHVVAFADLPPPGEWVFRLGIAYPQRARIEGRGVGAVRHCEFSTGAFVEPITRWEEPTRLSFDVVSQPQPMHEWSPYRQVYAPHLVGNMRSRRGEFRLIALPGGRTRLEGSTWYEIELFPQFYWTPWSDALIHAIHGRVLRHIKHSVESA